MSIRTEPDFLSIARDALDDADSEVIVAASRAEAYRRIYSRAIELFDTQGRAPTAEEVMQSFSEPERDLLLESAGAA